MNVKEIKIELEKIKGRSYWERGVKDYALEFIDETIVYTPDANFTRDNIKDAMLNGAKNCSEWAWGGCGLIYDENIARRLCTPSELKKKRGGELQPNSRENWLDVEARAFYQAYIMIKGIIPKNK